MFESCLTSRLLVTANVAAEGGSEKGQHQQQVINARTWLLYEGVRGIVTRITLSMVLNKFQGRGDEWIGRKSTRKPILYLVTEPAYENSAYTRLCI